MIVPKVIPRSRFFRTITVKATIGATNTSAPANGGFITGFVFAIDSADDGAAGSLLPGASHPLFLNTGPQAAPPFGGFDAGAALGGDWTGGGSPAGGIAVGATGDFNFNITASDFASLTASSFINGPDDYNFVVRFRGFVNGASDKVPGQIVPAPGALALLGIAGLFGARRNRR